MMSKYIYGDYEVPKSDKGLENEYVESFCNFFIDPFKQDQVNNTYQQQICMKQHKTGLYAPFKRGHFFCTPSKACSI